MFFVPFLIMFREGLEAALIVSLIAGYLQQTQRQQWLRVVWIGVLLACLLCLGLGWWLNQTSGEFPQKEQELFEGLVAAVAVLVLTWMVFWMRRAAQSVKTQLQDAVDQALNHQAGPGWALVCMVFFAVAREGLESVFFLLASFQQEVGLEAPIGALTGLCAAIVTGGMIYWGGVKLPLQQFFRWTALFMLLVAAGLAAASIRAFHEAGIWNHFQNVAFDLSNVLSTHTLVGTLLESLFGYQETPSVSEVGVYLMYLIPALGLFFRRPPRVSSSSPAVCSVSSSLNE